MKLERSHAPLPLLACAVALTLLVGCGDDSRSSTSTVTSTDTVSDSTDATGSGTIPLTTTEATTTADGSAPEADVMVTNLTGFTSPTGNIGCYIDRRNVRCDIAERDWDPPARPAGCSLDFGQGISLDAGGAPAFVCAGDTALGGGDPLPYGQSIGAGLLRCLSEESGMSCIDAETGRGFKISRESYDLG